MPYISGGMNYGGAHIKRVREKERKELAASRERARRLREEKQRKEAEDEKRRQAAMQESVRRQREEALTNFKIFLEKEKYLDMIALIDRIGILPEFKEQIPMQVSLYYGIRKGDIQAVRNALDQKADINDTLRLAHTPLVYALGSSVKMLDYLWESKADISLCHQIDRIPPVFHAILCGDFYFDKFKWFIDKGINIHTLRDKDGLSALHYAAKANNYSVMRFLLENKFDVNEMDKKGLTPLQYFNIKNIHETKIIRTEYGEMDVTKTTCIDLLIKHGAKYLVPHDDESAYYVLERMILFAAQNKNEELVEILLKSVNTQDAQRLRLAAVAAKNHELVQTLLHSVPQEDIRQLMSAAINVSDCKLLSMIASCDTNRRCINDVGNDLLIEAIRRGSYSLVSMLVELGVTVQLNQEMDRALDEQLDRKIRPFLTVLSLKTQLAEYKKQALEEAKQSYCFWNCSSTAPLKRVKAADALIDVLVKKQEVASLDNFNKLILADPKLSSFKEKLERDVLKPIADEKSGWFNWPTWLHN